MNSRAASATSSRKAKQHLVNLLFKHRYAGKGPEAHRKLDHSIYAYSELRKAYLEEVHSIHPDKSSHDPVNNTSKHDMHERFVELQTAWDDYEKFAKMMKSVSKGDKADADFTMFGVGCSFSDSPEERDYRTEITDQACRGWFSAGAIAEKQKGSGTDTEAASTQQAKPLLDDDWFVHMEEEHEVTGRPTNDVATRARRTLVDIPARMRRR